MCEGGSGQPVCYPEVLEPACRTFTPPKPNHLPSLPPFPFLSLVSLPSLISCQFLCYECLLVCFPLHSVTLYTFPCVSIPIVPSRRLGMIPSRVIRRKHYRFPVTFGMYGTNQTSQGILVCSSVVCTNSRREEGSEQAGREIRTINSSSKGILTTNGLKSIPAVHNTAALPPTSTAATTPAAAKLTLQHATCWIKGALC